MSDIEIANTRSSRDIDDVRVRLERWLKDRTGPDASVTGLSVPSRTGMSSESMLFDATWTPPDGGARRSASLVARLAPDPADVPVFPTYDLAKQYRLMGMVGQRTSVPVPAVLWCEPDATPLGSPFFVMARVDGVVPPDVLPYCFGDSWLFDATPEQQARLRDESVAVLAALHRVDGEEAKQDFGFLDLDRPELTPLRRHVGDQGDYYRWAMDGLRVPVLERSFAWLDEHLPVDEGPTVLSWGDSRIGNILFRDFAPVAVLDWEMAMLGPREADLGWMIWMHRFFQDLAESYGLAGMPAFMRRDDAAATYERLTGHTPRAIEVFMFYGALRHGIIMARIQRRAIRFGQAAMPDDPDELVVHRETLETMMAGSYWARL
ncbi:MAG: aminoglycoside phosphotransferase-like protein [Acidimicrobiales bacterium]|nr:aminoglycoside phosphotransferase-like protein [Acidimicrobiales bacterium]